MIMSTKSVCVEVTTCCVYLWEWSAMKVRLVIKTSLAQGVNHLLESSVNYFTCLKDGWQPVSHVPAFTHWIQNPALRWCWMVTFIQEVASIQDTSDPLLVPWGPALDSIGKISCRRGHSCLDPKHSGSSAWPLHTFHLGSHPCTWILGFYTIPCFSRLPPSDVRLQL